MTSKLLVLLKTLYRNQSKLNELKHEKDKKKRGKTIGVFVAYGILAIMAVSYSFGLAYGFGMLGLGEIVSYYAITVAAIINLVFTFLKTNGILFAGNDYDVLMSLPFSTKTVITAKFLYMYLKNLMWTAIIMLPMGAAYMCCMGVTASDIIIWLVITLFTPLIPMTIASAVGALIIGIGSGFRYKVLVQTILIAVFMIAIFAVSFFFQSAGANPNFEEELVEMGAFIQEQMAQIYPLSAWFAKAVNDGEILFVGLYIVVSFVLYGMFASLVGWKYKKINSALMTSHKNSNYKVEKMKEKSVLYALMWKEAKRFTSSITYISNIGMGIFLAILAAIACAVIGVDSLLMKMGLSGYKDNMTYALPVLVLAVLAMGCTTGVSLSLEGKNYWIVQSLPITKATLYKGKMLFNLSLGIPTAFICSILLMIACKPSIMVSILYFIIMCAGVCLSTTFGMFIGKNFPKFDWEEEIQVIKQGMASTICIFANMFFFLIVTVVVYALSLVFDGVFVMLGVSVFMMFFAFLFYKKVVKE